ncbi:MAG: alpha/beta hydrolase [Myxococcota bacterium]
MIAAPTVSDRSRLVPLSSGRVFIRDLIPDQADSDVPPIVLLHGLMVTSHSFRDVIPGLATDRRVIAVDLPGCGESDRPDPSLAGDYAVPWLSDRLAEMLQVLELPQVDLLGHSFGGTVALCFASEHAAALRRLVLVDPVAFPLELPLEGRLALVPRLGPYVFKTLYRRADLRRYLGRVVSTPELADETALNVYWDRLSRDGGREAAYAMLGHLTLLPWLRPRLSTIDTEALVVWGDRDSLMPVSEGQRLVDLLVRARLQVVDGCGHAVPEERPDRLTALVREFCAGGPAPAPPPRDADPAAR